MMHLCITQCTYWTDASGSTSLKISKPFECVSAIEISNEIRLKFHLFGINSRQHCDNYLTHLYPPKPHPLLSLPSSFSPNLKHCSTTNSILTCSLTRLNSKHHIP